MMNSDRQNLWRKRGQHGFGMVELMVGLVIGLISVLVVYEVYTVAEGFKRNTTATGEAQQTGLFSMFTLGLDLANAGSGVIPESPNLASCSDPGGAMPMRFAQFYRPVPAVIADSGTANVADTFVLSYSTATTLQSAAFFTPNPGFPVASAPFLVQSPGGFHVNDLAVIIPNPGSPTGVTPCGTAKITAVALTNDVQGDALLTETPVDPPGGIDLSALGGPMLLNMGPCNRVQKVMYSLQAGTWDNKPVCDAGTPCSLYATPLLDASAGASCGKPANPFNPSPIATNIVNMKVQYGIDTDKDVYRTLDTWVPASNGANGDWTWNTLMSDAMLISQNGAQNGINQIRAVRIGVIIQSEQFDQTLGDYNWVLFDCSTHNAACPGRLTGTITKQANPAGNWRFRTYETVIPLRSAIYQRF
jgi:type IV pilus assembly protein PilW